MSDNHSYSSDFNRGRAGLPPRNMYYNAAEQAGRNAAANGDSGGGLGLILVAVAVLAAIVALAIAAAVAAIAALPCAYLLIWITRAFSPRDEPDFGEAYKTSFIGLAVTLTVAAGLTIAMHEGYLTTLPGGVAVMWLSHGAVGMGALSAPLIVSLAVGILMLLAPGLVAFAFVLRSRIGSPYEGGAGFMRGLLAGLVVVGAPGLAIAAVGLFLSAYAEPAMTKDDEIAMFLGVAFAIVAVVAIAGGLVLAGALMLFGGGLAKGGPLFQTAWYTGAVAMALTAGAAAAAIFLFRDADPGLQAFIALTREGMGTPPAFSDALPGFLKLTVPGALAGAFFVAGNLYAYRGVIGWVKAVAITVPLGLLSLIATILYLATLR